MAGVTLQTTSPTAESVVLLNRREFGGFFLLAAKILFTSFVMTHYNKIMKEKNILCLFVIILFSSLVYAQKAGERIYKSIKINGEKVNKWVDCLEVIEYDESGNIIKSNNVSDFSAERVLYKDDHIGKKLWPTINTDECIIEYKTVKEIDENKNEEYIRRFKDNQLFYEVTKIVNDGDELIQKGLKCEYDANNNIVQIDIKEKDDEYDGYFLEKGCSFDTKGNVISFSEESMTYWLEYDKYDNLIRFFTEENGWKNYTKEEDTILEKITFWESKKKELQSIKKTDIDWNGNIGYYTQNQNSLYFEVNPEGQLLNFKDSQYSNYEESYQYDTQGKEIFYSKRKETPLNSLLIKNPAWPYELHEEYTYNSKGNKIKCTKYFYTIFFGLNYDGWEEYHLSSKGNKTSFKNSNNKEVFYLYEYYPDGGIKKRCEYSYVNKAEEGELYY